MGNIIAAIAMGLASGASATISLLPISDCLLVLSAPLAVVGAIISYNSFRQQESKFKRALAVAGMLINVMALLVCFIAFFAFGPL
jgi:hypothetical protein